MKTVSLDLAKQLKEAGYPQEGTYYWGQRKYPSQIAKNKFYSPDLFLGIEEPGLKVLAASPTADEILDQLPAYLEYENTEYYLIIDKEGDLFTCDYHANPHGSGLLAGNGIGCDVVVANAAAKMWLYLKKEGLI